MASEVADIPQAVCEKIEAEDRKLVNETTNIELDKLLKEERMDAEDTPNQPHETLKCNFEVENVKDTKEGSAGAAEGENFLNLPSMTKVSVKANDGSPDAYEVVEKLDQTKKDACKIQSLEDEKIDNRPVEIISTKETTSEEIQQNAEELSTGLDKVEDRHAVPVESTANSTDATSGLKVEDSIHVPDSEDARMDTKKLKDASIAETGAEKFGSGKFTDNFDVALEKGSQETITFSEDTINLIENEGEPQDQNNSESSFLKDAEDIVIQEGDKAATAPEVSEMGLENILNRSIGEEENQSTTLEEIGDHSIQTASEKTEENSLKQVDESQIKHEECLQNESGKLSSTEAPTQDTNHEGIETGDLKKANIADDERSSENYLPNEKPVESLHVSPVEIKTSASCQNAETISPSLEQRLFANPQEILSDETKDKTIDAVDAKDVATIDPNEAAGGSIPYGSANDLNVTHPHPLEEGKDNDRPSIDAPVNNSNNICSKEGGDQINNIEDQDDSEASCEVTEDQNKETGSQMMDREHNTTTRSEATADETIKICQEVNDDQKMTSKPDDIETQGMDREHDTAIQSEATADETTKICQETTELKVTDSSENIEKIILLDENRNQHVSVASILEEKIAESSEGDKTITDIPSQEDKGASNQEHDGWTDSSTQIIDKDSGAKDNLTVLCAEEMETEVSCEEEKKIKEPDTEIREQRLQNQDTDQQIVMETDGFKDNCIATLEENSSKESSQEDEGSKESKSVEAEQSTREVLNSVVPSSAIGENKLDENLKIDERNVTISEQEIKNAEKEGTGENFEGMHFSEDSKGKTLEHEEESGTTCIIQSSIQSEEEEMSSKDCLDSAQNLSSVSEISEGSGEDIIDTTEMAVTVGTEDPNLKEVELQDKTELDENDLASEKPVVATSKPDKKEAESINIESEHESISNLGENRDVNVSVMGGNEANETVTGEITKYEVQNDAQAALSKCKDQVAAAGNFSHDTLELNLGESYSSSYEEQNLLPVSANETKVDNSENIEGSRIIPDSSSAVKTAENIDTEKAVVGQDTARNSDDFSKEHLDTQKSALESKTEHENRMEDLDSMTEKDQNNSESSFLKGAEDVVIQEGNKTATAPEVSQMVLENILNRSTGEEEKQTTTLEEVGDHSIQTTSEKTEENSLKQVDDESQIKHEECLQNESRKLSSTEAPTQDTNHEGIETGDLKKAKISEDLPYEKSVESLHISPQEIKTSASCQNAETISPSREQILFANPQEILSDETKDKTIDAADAKDVATIDPNEAGGGSIPYGSANDLNVTHPLEEGKVNDGPSIDAPVNNSNNICSKEGGDQINNIEDQDDSEATCEVTKDQSKETKSQVNDDQKMTNKPDDIESQMMDREHNSTIRSEATADETIKICQEVNDDQKMTSKPDDIETQVMDWEHDTPIQSEATADETTMIFQETTELKVTDSSENIEKIILLDENRNQHVSVASILEEKIAEISEGDKTITDIPSQEVGPSYQEHDGCIDSSTQIIDKDSGAKGNSTVLSAEETETEVSYEEEKKIKEPHTEVMQNPESVEPTIELPSTSEPVIEFQVNRGNPENTITAMIDDDIKTMEEKNESIGEILISQHSLDGKVDTNDDGREHKADDKQHIDSIQMLQGIEKANESDNTAEQEEKVIEQDFESSQRAESCETKIQLGADDPINRAPNCDQIITGGSLSEEILQVQRENESADSRWKIKEQIEEEGCLEDVQMIAAVDVAMHEEKGLDSSSIKNLDETLSDDSKEKMTLDSAEDLNREQAESSVTKVSGDEKLANMTNLESVATQGNSEYKIVHEPSSFHDKTDAKDVQVLDDSITFSSKENLVQVDPEESTELQVPCGEKVESMQHDPITYLREIEEQQPGNASEAVSKEKMTLDIAEDLNQEQEESSVTKVSEDEKLANITSLASVATEENSDYKIVHEPSSFHDKTDIEDVQVLDDSITFSSKENLVQVDPEESTELQVPSGEKVESMQQDPITVMEEIEEQQPRNASEAVSEAGGVNYEGATITTESCKEIMDSSSFVELDEISPFNPLQESKKKILQVGEDEGTEKQQDDLHTLAHIDDSPMGITQKDAQLCVASVDGSEDTQVKEKLVADSLPASDKNMVEEAEFMESEFAENETSNKNIQQLQQEDTSETFLTDVKDMKPAEGEPEEAKCGQEKITVVETIESGEESTSIEIAKSSPPDILQIYSVETSHAEDHSTKEKELTINREELHAEKTEPNEDGAELQEDKDEEEEAGNQKESAVDVAIYEEKGLDSSSIKNLAETSSDDSKEKITLDITNGLNREQEESSGTKMSEDEKLASMTSLASKATEENSDYKIVDESHSFHDKTDIRDVQVLEASITCSNKENTVQEDPTESTDQVPRGETVELMQQDPITVLEEIEEQQTENAFEAVSEAKGVNREGEKRITDNCEEIMATSSFVALDEISHSKPLPESRTEILQQGEEKETGNQHDGLRILAHTIDSPMEITEKDAPLCIASADGSDDSQVMHELEVASLQALDKHVVDEENYEEISHVEVHSTKEKELMINKEELQEEKTEPIEDKGAKTQEEKKEEEEEAGKQKRSGFASQALTLVEESDRDVTGSVSEAPEENLNFKVEEEANKFNDKADTTPSTVMKKETSLEEICVSTNSHDETPEITNTTSDDLEGLEVESVRVEETVASVPQSETIEAQHADIGSAVKKQSESNEVEFADEENKAGAVYKSNDQNVEELKSWEFPTLRKNKSENSEKETDKDYEKGFESKCERAEAVIEDNITCDQVKQELQEKSLELLSKVQSCENKLQSAENNDHRTNEEGMEHGDDTSKDEDGMNYSTKNEEVDNTVDSNLEILHPDKLEKVLESETQVQSFEVITKGEQTKTEEENLEAAKEEIRAEKTVAEEICEAIESKKIDMSSEKIKDEDVAVEDCQLGSPKEETIPEMYQEDEEETEEDPKVKTEEAIKSANENEKVSEKIEEAYVDENVSKHIVFDNKAVEEANENLPVKESIDGILQVKEEGKIVEGITTIVNNQEKARELDDVYVETEREVPSEEVNSSAVAFLEHGEDRTGADEDTGLQNKNINFSPMGDAAAGEPLDNENIISEAAPTKLIHETIQGCEDNNEIFMREQEDIERKDEKLPISESLGDEESEAKKDKNQHEFETEKQLKDEDFISDKVQEKYEEQEMLSAGEAEVKEGEADTCSRQTEGENINNYDQVENPDFSSHGKNTSEISHSYGVLGIAKDNENSTDIRTHEKIFTGTTKSEISEATYPNESGEATTSRVSKDIQLMEQDSEAITVDAEMQESKAGNASSDVQEGTGVQCGEEEKADDDYKEMTETSTSMECPISTIMQGSAVETPVVVEDQETQDQLTKLPDFPHLPHIQDSEMGKTEEDGPVDLQKTSNMTRDMQDLDERSIALLNKENLAKTDPNESKKNKVSSDGRELELNQQDSVPPTLQQEIEKQQPGNSSETVSDAKEAICKEEKVTTANCNEVTENNSCVASDKVSPYNMLQGSSSEAAQGTNDKNIPTQHHELPILSDIKFSDMERTQMDVELRVERVDGIDVRKVEQNLDAASIPASDKQTVIDADNTKNDDAFNSTVESKNIPQMQQDTAEIFQAEGEIWKPCELEQEERTIESTKKSASTEIAKASLSDILQGPLKESSEMADHHTEGIEPTIQKKELNAEKTEEAEHLEEKDSHEESSEQKISDLGSEAPVMVDAGDVDAKVAHKKSHNILSGVGSKVKHSIAKVKKAIIGKSSHPKPTSPKESEKC